MTLLWLDNFSQLGYNITVSELAGDFYYVEGTWPNSQYPSSRTSTAGYLEFGYRDGIQMDISKIGNYSTLTFGFALSFNEPFNSAGIIRFGNGSGNHLTLDIGATPNQLSVEDANSSSVATFDYTLNWQYIEVKLTLGQTTGACEIRRNGQQVVNVSNQDFYSGTDYIEYILLYNNSSGTLMYASEFYITDGDFLGPIRVRSCLPNADGNYTNFTPSSGTDHYAMVDEAATDEDSTYNEGSQVGDKDTYSFDTSSIVGTIKGVSLSSHARRTGGSALKFKNMVRVNNTDYDGSDEFYTDATYEFHRQVWENNPNTSSPWTSSDLSNAEFGVHITALSTTTTT